MRRANDACSFEVISVYFSATLSALNIPPWSLKAVQIIEAEYEKLADIEQYGESAVSNYINKWILPKIKHPITFSDLMAAYKLVKEKKISSSITSEVDIYAAEYNVLCKGTTTDDETDGEYAASIWQCPDGYNNIFESITIIDKLTVVNALVGFTRVDPWDGTLYGNNRLAPLSIKKKNWRPANKLLGEGIFFKFNQTTLYNWERYIGNRYNEMASELIESFLENERFSPQYVALHTFAHLLIRQLSDDCGYSVSSIKEKIYCTFTDELNRPEMCGVLIYLATSDAEGSLGGLIILSDNKKCK